MSAKILYKDQIVESFRFPFSEALSFSILVWTIYGLLESFYLQRVIPIIVPSAGERVHSAIYISAFFMYLALAALTAALIYGSVKWILFTTGRLESPRLRGATVALILGAFFAMVLYHALSQDASEIPTTTRYIFAGLLLLFACTITLIIFRRASDVGFRLRRSGTTMLSVLILSLVLSFVPFPLFAPKDATKPADKNLDLKESIQKLLVYNYLSIVTPSEKP